MVLDSPGCRLNVFLVVTTTVSSFGAIASVLLVWRQLREQSRQRCFSALTDLHEKVIEPEMQAALRRVFAADPSDLQHPNDERTLNDLELVLGFYDLVGARLRFGLIPFAETMATEWSTVLRVKNQVHAFLAVESARRGIPYKTNFLWLADESERVRQKEYPTAEVRAFRRDFAGNIGAVAEHVPRSIPSDERRGTVDHGE
jgi:hypothetical protein